MQKKGFKKILIIILAILVLIIVYAWYSSRPDKIQPQGAVVPVTGSAPAEDLAVSEKAQLPQAKEIIRILSLLNKIKLDTDFFNSKSFKSLDDFSVQLPSLEPGRNNPFAPLETGLPAQTSSE